MASELNDVSVGNTRQLLQQLAGRQGGGGGGGYEGHGVGEISENQPIALSANVVRSCEALDTARPPEGVAGAMKAQLMTKRDAENGTKAGPDAFEEGVVEPGMAKHIREQLREQAERGGRVQKEAIVIDKQAQPIISENQPYQRHGIIREADQSDSEKGLVLAAGHARQIASALLSPREDSKGERSMVNVKEDIGGPNIVENNPTTRTDVVHSHDRVNDLPSVDTGFAKGLAMQFVQKKCQQLGDGKVKDVMVLPGATEAGVFENHPMTREGVVRESDKLEETDVIPDKVTSAMRQVWQDRGVLVELAKPNQALPTASLPKSPAMSQSQKSAAASDVSGQVTKRPSQQSGDAATRSSEAVSDSVGHGQRDNADSLPANEHHSDVQSGVGGSESGGAARDTDRTEAALNDKTGAGEGSPEVDVSGRAYGGEPIPDSHDEMVSDMRELTAPCDLPEPEADVPLNNAEHEATAEVAGDEGRIVGDRVAEGSHTKVAEHDETAMEQEDLSKLVHDSDRKSEVEGDGTAAEGSNDGDSKAAKGSNSSGSNVVGGGSDGDSKVVEGSSDGDSKVMEGSSDGDSKVVEGSSDGDSKVMEGSSDGDNKVVEGSSDSDNKVVEGSSDSDSKVVGGSSDSDSKVVGGSDSSDNKVVEESDAGHGKVADQEERVTYTVISHIDGN